MPVPVPLGLGIGKCEIREDQGYHSINNDPLLLSSKFPTLHHQLHLIFLPKIFFLHSTNLDKIKKVESSLFAKITFMDNNIKLNI
jgi:hypothetical protein